MANDAAEISKEPGLYGVVCAMIIIMDAVFRGDPQLHEALARRLDAKAEELAASADFAQSAPVLRMIARMMRTARELRARMSEHPPGRA